MSQSQAGISTEPTTVAGVIHPHGVGGGALGIGSNAKWRLRFSFETWRDEDGILQHSLLTITKEVTHQELQAYMDRLDPYKVYSARVALTGTDSAELIEALEELVDISDPLLQHAAELLKPITHDHELLGTFTLDRRVGWYEGQVLWTGSQIQLNLSASDDTELETVLRIAVELWQNQSLWNQRIQDYAIQEMLDLKNTIWIDEDETELTPDEFKSRMILEAITIYPEGEFEFWHDDSDLFLGHSIYVKGNLQDGPLFATIQG